MDDRELPGGWVYVLGASGRWHVVFELDPGPDDAPLVRLSDERCNLDDAEPKAETNSLRMLADATPGTAPVWCERCDRLARAIGGVA